RGYLNRALLTSDKLCPQPHENNDAAGARMYRIGDKVCLQRDGRLVFMGRIDHQVKVRGFRIELGEIESVLSSTQGVEQCVVVATSLNNNEQNKYLVAYWVGDASAEDASL